MIKRIVCLVLTLILSLSCCAALADDPQPIETIPYEELPPAIDGREGMKTLEVIHACAESSETSRMVSIDN